MPLEILEKISEVSNEDCSQKNILQEEIPETKYLFFFIGKKKYGVKESQVVNVLRESRLYYFPFAPEFIDGVVNCHNQICPAINYEKLSRVCSEHTNLSLFIVMRTESDLFAVRVTAVEDFYMVPDECLVDMDEDFCKVNCSYKKDFIQGILCFNDEKIPVLNVQSVNQSIGAVCRKET